MGLVIGYDPREKAFVIKNTSTKVKGLIADDIKFGVLGATGTNQQTNSGTHSTTYDFAGSGSCNVASINVALGAVQDKVNAVADILAAFGLTT